MKVRTFKNDNTQTDRMPWVYTETVEVPEQYRKFLWDYPGGKAPLEIVLLRLFTYGRFEDIRWAFSRFSEPSYQIILRYPDIRRGVKFWIKHWYERELR
jgi:hypothetical protein